MKRNSSIELYRVMLMLGICFLHALQQGGYVVGHRGLDNVVNTSLVGFVFISGWFGIRFSWKKVFKLLGVAVYCGLIVSCLKYVVLGWEGNLLFHLHRGILSMKFCWFLWAYLGLMMTAPLLDPLVGRMKDDGPLRMIPFLVLVFGWSYAAYLPVVRNLVPANVAFSPFSFVTFVGIYLVARYLSVTGLAERWCGLKSHVGTVLLGVLVWVGFYHMNSPIALAFTALVFMRFKRMTISAGVGRVCGFLVPSLFSVYLIHTNGAGFELIHRAEYALIECRGVNYYLAALLVGVVIFISSLLADLPRRAFLTAIMWIGRRRVSASAS